jgi:threonyl-tRNA synthetase
MDSAKKAVESVTEGVKKVAIGGEGKKGKKEKKAAGGSNDAGGSRPLELNPRPSFIQDRIDLFDRLKKKYEEDTAKKPREPITITLPDNSIKQGTSWETSPADIAKGISSSLYKRVIVARLDGDPEQRM